MTDRDRLIVELRPILVTIKKDSSSSELEIFQNQSNTYKNVINSRSFDSKTDKK